MSDGKEITSEIVEQLRMKSNALVVIVALIILGLIFWYALSKMTEPADITAILSAFTTIFGTIIGAYFGINVGAAGKQDAINTREDAINAQRKAENDVKLLALATKPSVTGITGDKIVNSLSTITLPDELE